MNCPYCGAAVAGRQTGEVGFRVSHNVTLCELIHLRKLRDSLTEWAEQAEAFDRDGGTIAEGFKVGTDLDSVVAKARELKGAASRESIDL